MLAKLSKVDTEKIIAAVLQGKSYDEIAKEFSTSHGTVARIVAKWKEDLGGPASDAMLVLAKALRKLDLPPSQCAEAAEIIGLIKNLGTKPEKVKEFLNSLIFEITSKGVAVSTIADPMLQLLQLSSKSNTPLEEIPDRLSDAIAQEKAISQNIEQLKVQLKDRQKELDDVLSQKRVVMQNIDICVQVEKDLKPLGLSLTDFPKVICLVNNMSTLGHDPTRVAALFSSIDNLENKKEELATHIKSQQALINGLSTQINNLHKSINGLRDLDMSLRKLASLGFDSTMMKDLADKIEQIAKDRSLPLQGAAMNFLIHVKQYYDNVLGFETVLSQLKKDIDKKSKELDEIQTDCALYKEAADSRMMLMARLVQDRDLIYWSSVFRDNPSLQPQMLTDWLKEYSDLQTVVNKLKIAHDNLKTTIQTGNMELDTLLNKKQQVLLDLEQLKKTIAEEQSRRMTESAEMQRHSIEFLSRASETALTEATKQAFLKALDLVPVGSPLLPIFKYEKGGKLPEQKEVLIATYFLMRMLLRYLESADPLRVELERVADLVDKKLGIVVTAKGCQEEDNGNGRGSGNTDDIAVEAEHPQQIAAPPHSATSSAQTSKAQEETISKDNKY